MKDRDKTNIEEMGTIVLLMCVMIFIPEVAYGSSNWQYGAILDAGSSSTKLKIYRWPPRTSLDSVLDIKQVGESEKHSPGISDYVDKLGNISNYIGGMIERVKEIIPKNVHSTTSLYLLATAGLRVLPEDDARSLMNAIRNVLQNKTLNPFVFNPSNVRILSGEEEGVFAWITINYLKDYFGSDRPQSQAVGVLEMGGGSTQIVFLPDGPLLANMFQVRIAGKRYSLYAHSYLFYGQDYMIFRIGRYIIQQNPQSSSHQNPCMLTGDTTTKIYMGATKTFIGEGNPSKCLTIINSFLKSAADDMCYPKPCAIGRTYQPSIGTDNFYAIAAFTYAPRSLGTVDSSGKLNMSRLNETAFNYCQKSLTDATTNTSISEKYGSAYCLMGLYIPALLSEAYGFTSETQKITLIRKIKDISVDWTLGAIVYETEVFETKCGTSAGHISYPDICFINILLLLTYLMVR
ncbi:ectonucleoside triphosphate diphosphohydrolase 1-like isoform X3 [Mytilus galloprovincialis]|uniref:ectonucleoside triphosphate diphosphohydrolase 1-like isoform X3 n=1 Tax=Mytilus galloprovincialis TaxID=29158 RepID=UPI003F7BD78A